MESACMVSRRINSMPSSARVSAWITTRMTVSGVTTRPPSLETKRCSDLSAVTMTPEE